MKILKDKQIAISIHYRERLRDYILENADFIFSEENEADSWCDFIQWPDKKTDRIHLCLPKEPMLIDRNHQGVHTFCVCTISEKRKITAEYPVIAVDELPRHVWKNGYFLLPDLLRNHPDRQ